MFCGQCGKASADGNRFCLACGADLASQQGSSRASDPLDNASTRYADSVDENKVLAGRYRVRELLGRGTMGEVWRAEDAELDGMTVAIKVLPVELARDARRVEALKKEARLTLRLTHSNICRVHQLQADGELRFLTMEFIAGQTLEALLDEQPDRRMALEELLPLAGQIAAALDYAHGEKPPVLHRDIKPANMMITPDGVAKLLDFGIAREIKDSMTGLTGHVSSGTPLYMSPEQHKGKSIGPASDIYSLAATLYECLAGRPPFHRGDIAYQLLRTEPSAIDGLGEEVNRVLGAALAKSAKDRPRTAADLVEALGRSRPKQVGKEGLDTVASCRASAEQGHAEAQYRLGFMYANGRGVDRDDKQAVEWYRKAADQGTVKAQCYLGWMYEKGRGVDRDDKQAVEWFRKAAEQGDAVGQSSLGWMYANGRGVDKDDKQAVKWYRKAAEQGHAHAQLKLSWHYKDGCGVDQNHKEKVQWCRKAAEQGYAHAQWNLGWDYMDGRGVEQDDKKAVHWFRKAAEQGDGTGQVFLDKMIRAGRSVDQDDQQAVEWYRKAAEQGDADAQNNLGWMYANGRGVDRDDKKAVEWYRKAAEQGFAKARKMLDRMISDGRAVD